MALNPDYAHKTGSYLSEIQLPGSETVYYLKDADLRAIVEGFGSATAKDALVGAIADNTTSGDLATAAQIVAYVTSAVAGLTGAMHFVEGNRETAKKEAGNVILEGTKEYIYDGTKWVELGDEGVWVPNTRKIADIDLQNDITADALKNKLGIKAMGLVDKGTVTITPKGNITVTLKDAAAATDATIAEKADYQPAGTIASADATGTEVNYTPAGDVGINPTTATFSAGSVTTVADSPATQFAQAGITASVTGEKLTFADATKAVALVKSDITVGTAPSLKNGTTDITAVMTGATGSFSGKGTKLSFTGTTSASLIPTKVTYVKPEVDAANTKFAGTAEDYDVDPKSST